MLLTACQPFAAISINAEDGGSPAHPKVLYTGAAAKFVHSARWPREGADTFALIGADSSIKEQGYFLSLGSSSSSPKWAGKDDVPYSIDYQRGIDILRCRGEHYVPGAPPEPGRIPGTNGETPPIAPSAAQVAQRTRLAQRLKAEGWSPGLCHLAAQRI